MKSRWLSPWLRRLALREWLALFIAMLLLAGELSEGDTVNVDAGGAELTFRKAEIAIETPA